MKFTAAATVLASSITASAESLPNPAGGSLSNAANEASHHSLAVAMKGQDDIKGILKERRFLKKTNNVSRNLQDKLKRRTLRNQATEDGITSNAELDIGLFSRDLQQNITEGEREETLSVIEVLVKECSDNGYCTCSNVDVDAYTATVTCSYEEECYGTADACEDQVDFCQERHIELHVTAPATGYSKNCYSVNAPLEFTYCYGLEYFGEAGPPTSCFLELDGSKCNSCEWVEGDAPDTYCTVYDCSNVDADYIGTECSEKTIARKRVEDFVLYSPLPCENGCNICPEGEEITIFYEYVTFALSIDKVYSYTCTNLFVAGLKGKLNDIPSDMGDLCYSLESVVDGPCACEVPPTPWDNTDTDTATYEAPVEATIEGIDSEGTDKSSLESESAGARFGSDGFAIVAIVASIFSWTVM